MAVAGGGAARSLLTARACWTMDVPTEDAMARESTRMWCVAVVHASPCATRRTPCCVLTWLDSPMTVYMP